MMREPITKLRFLKAKLELRTRHGSAQQHVCWIFYMSRTYSARVVDKLLVGLDNLTGHR